MAHRPDRPPNPALRGAVIGALVALAVGAAGALLIRDEGPGLAGFGAALRGGAVVAFGVPVAGLAGFAVGFLHGRRRLARWRAGSATSSASSSSAG